MLAIANKVNYKNEQPDSYRHKYAEPDSTSCLFVFHDLFFNDLFKE